MKNPLLTGAASCLISGIFWTIILLSMWLESEGGLGAAGVYILWLIVGAPLALILSGVSFYLTYRKPKADTPRLNYSVRNAKIISWVSFSLVAIPALLMLFAV